MAFSWEESEYADVDDEVSGNETDARADAVVSAIDNDDLDDLDDQLEDVEKRLEVASLYRLLLKDRLFDLESPAARQVENRIRRFVKTELKVLLGLQAPANAVKLPFTEDQLSALIHLADKVLGRSSAEAAPSSTNNAVRRVESAPPAQAVRQVRQPAPVVRQQPVAPKRPAPTPAPRQASPAPAAPGPKRRNKAPVVVKEQQISADSRDTAVTQIETNGRTTREYKDAEGRSMGKRDMTPQVRPSTALAMPTPDQMHSITSQQAMQSVMAAGAAPTLSD